jgi:hypothetical protein
MNCRSLLPRLGALAAGMLLAVTATHAAEQAKPAISEEASAALLRMGQTLCAQQFSFQADTIRVYSETNGEPLHIFHTLKATVDRPSRLAAEIIGDDGSGKLRYDGETLTLFTATENKYVSAPIPDGTLEGMLKEAVGRYGVDFPLADFLSEAPNKAFLTRVTSGRVVNTVTIDGAPYLHLFFTQPPGIELELWVEKSDRALPRRLIVTYRSLPSQPNFIAGFSDWNFSIHPSEADFAFQPPQGAVQVALKAPTPISKGKRRQAMKRLTAVCVTGLFAVSLAPDAYAWGAYHGGFGGAHYSGAFGSATRVGDSWHATGFRGSTASGSNGSWSASGYRGGTASGSNGSWSAHGAYRGTASGGGGSWSGTNRYGQTAYGGYGGYYGGASSYHGGTYYGGTTVVTPGYTGWGAAAAGAAVGATTAAAATATTANAYAASTYNYYPPPYYRPYAY